MRVERATMNKAADAALDRYARIICDLRPAVAAAAPFPLALHARWLHHTRGLVDAGVARIVGVGDKVRVLEGKKKGRIGLVIGEADGGTELLVDVGDYRPRNYCAGKRENRWDLAAL